MALASRDMPDLNDDAVISTTRKWVERAVVGLGFCPFAKPLVAAGRIRYSVTRATTPEQLQADLARELEHLVASDPASVETTLLIHPAVLTDFLQYNDFLDVADATLEELDLLGEIQVASFHPRYQFADTEPDDLRNHTNRSPYPMLHLLRESSVERAVELFPDPAAIYEKNIETLRALGAEGLARALADDDQPTST